MEHMEPELHKNNTSFIKRFDITLFYILACFFGWILYLVRFITHSNSEASNIPLGPFFAVLVLTLILGKSEFKKWLKSLRIYSTSFKWYLFAFLAPILLILISVIINSFFGAPLFNDMKFADLGEITGTFVAMFILVGIGEEAGWTAFLLPKILKENTFIKTWLILATLRIIWHIPLMITGELPIMLGLVGNAAFQFALLWIYTKSKRVWLLAAIWHAMLNAVSGNYFFLKVEHTDNLRLGAIMSLAYVALALVIYFLDRKNLNSNLDVDNV